MKAPKVPNVRRGLGKLMDSVAKNHAYEVEKQNIEGVVLWGDIYTALQECYSRIVEIEEEANVSSLEEW